MSFDVIKSRSLKEAYAMMFTSPSKLEAVKTEFNSAYLTDNEKSNKMDIAFMKITNIEKSKEIEVAVKDEI
jgi:hypothetical protein